METKSSCYYEIFVIVIFVMLLYEKIYKKIFSRSSYFPGFILETYSKSEEVAFIGKSKFIALKHYTSHFLSLFILMLQFLFHLKTLLMNMIFLKSLNFVSTFFFNLAIVFLTCFYTYKNLENIFFGNSFRQKL